MRIAIGIIGLSLLAFGCSASTGTTSTDATGTDDGAAVDTQSPLETTDASAQEPDASPADSDSVALDTQDVASDVTSPVAEPDQQITEPDVDPNDEIPPPTVIADFANCSEPGGQRNIYDIQDPQCPDHFHPEPTTGPGIYVTLSQVIVTAVFGDTYFVQEQNGGPYSGIAAYNHGEPFGSPKVGDVVDLAAYYYEFFDCSQLYLESLQITGSTTPPPPYVPTHPAHLASEYAIGEMFEGVLVRVEDVHTIHTKPDCPHDYGEFSVTGGLRVDDMGAKWDPHLGDSFASITGPLHYTFGNYKIEPRDDDDIAWLGKGGDGALSKCIAAECQAPEDQPGSHEIVINEVMADPFASDNQQEWIELYNPGTEPVDVYGYELRDCGEQKVLITGPDVVIPPKGYLVIGSDVNPLTNGGVSIDVAYGGSFYLPNTIGSVLLYDSSVWNANLIDQMRYSAFDNDSAFTVGRSLERISPQSNGVLPQSWVSGSAPFGDGDNLGTPGQKNSASN